MISDRTKSIDVFEILSIKSRWTENIKTLKTMSITVTKVY